MLFGKPVWLDIVIGVGHVTVARTLILDPVYVEIEFILDYIVNYTLATEKLKKMNKLADRKSVV